MTIRRIRSTSDRRVCPRIRAVFGLSFLAVLFVTPANADQITLSPQHPTSGDIVVAQFFAVRPYTPWEVISSVERTGTRVQVRVSVEGGFAVAGYAREDIEIGRLAPGKYTVELWSRLEGDAHHSFISETPLTVAPAAIPLGGLGGLIALAGALVGAGIVATRRRIAGRRS